MPILVLLLLPASAAKSKQHSGGKTGGKLLSRQPGSTAEGQERRGKSSEGVKAHETPPTSPVKQEKPACSSTSPAKGKAGGKSHSISSPKKAMLKNKEEKHGGGDGGGGGGGGGKGSSPKKIKLPQGPKAGSTGVGSRDKDSISHSVITLPVPPAEGARLLYKGANEFSAVAINKIEVRQRRKKLPTWPLLDDCVDDDSDYVPSEDGEEDEEWEAGGGGGGRGGESRDDVVHCICGSEVDEGFMIQVNNQSHDFITTHVVIDS